MALRIPVEDTFIQAQNAYFKVYRGEKVTADEYRKILIAHCDELTRLADGQPLREFLWELAEMASDPATAQEAYNLLGRYEEFSKFLFFEDKLLEQIGVEKFYRDHLISTMNVIHEQLARNIDALQNADDMIAKFQSLAQDSCEAAKQADARDWPFLRSDLYRRMMRVGGTIVVFADGLAPGVFPAGGLGIAIASASAGITMTELGS